MRFGVLSTARIARDDVIPAIRASSNEVLAVASRSEDRARQVANDLEIPRAYGSYETLLGDADLDAVYVPLPNALHAEWTRRAADEGLHVLCEKPLAVDAEEAAALFDYCEERGVTLMEAFMYHFHPRTRRAREIVADELGAVRAVEASFKFSLSAGGPADDIRLDPDLAGGSLMDVGCYAVSAARAVLGEPVRAAAHASDSRDCGVDTDFSGTLEFPDGAVAHVASGFDTPRIERYRVEAVDGWLEARDAFGPDADQAVELSYGVDGREATETFDPVDHYRLQVEAFADAAEAGREPPVSREESVRNARAMDALAESAERGAVVDVPDEE